MCIERCRKPTLSCIIVIFLPFVHCFRIPYFEYNGKAVYEQPRTQLGMCGVVGITLGNPQEGQTVCQELYDALIHLQHRGQDAAGIATSEQGKINLHRGLGLTREVFELPDMLKLRGTSGVGHVRYPTTGSHNSVDEAQPLLEPRPVGIALAHNGHLTNADVLRQDLSPMFHFNTDSDSEIILHMLALEMEKVQNKSCRKQLIPADIFSAVKEVLSRCSGGYAVVALLSGYGLLAFRDPHGIRPLILGSRHGERGTDWTVASESVAFTSLGFDIERDLKAGEAILIDEAGSVYNRICYAQKFTPCVYEYVYMARPDSVIDGVSVYKARQEMGVRLAKKIMRLFPDLHIDSVVPVPETSRITSVSCAYTLGLPYEEGITKNRYIARTFIMPGQDLREKSVRKKLSPVRHIFEDRCVLLVDDSIVRGTTSKQIVQMVREAGAKKVYFCSAAPPVRYPNIYGIDLAHPRDLLANGRNEEEIAAAIGADLAIFQDLSDLFASIISVNPEMENFDASVFDGQYITQDTYLIEGQDTQQALEKELQQDLQEQQNVVDVI